MQENYKHEFDWKRFDVLNVERNLTGRNITEILYTQSQPNSINKQDDTLLLNNMYTRVSQKKINFFFMRVPKKDKVF